MTNKTIKTVFTTNPWSEEIADILVSKLIELGFDGFENLENKLLAYIPANLYDEKKIKEIKFSVDEKPVEIEFINEELEEKNWNAVWEENFPYVVIKNKCLIHADFHKIEEDYPFRILIDPKMSFGTGHHETTELVMESMLEMDFSGKNLLDMGSGTGILAILASKMGAKTVLAIDNDKWAYENSLENVKKNNVKNVEILLGDAEILGNQTFEIIIANINRNILLQDLNKYSKVLKEEGLLILSGFYQEDIESIRNEAEKHKLKYDRHFVQKNWVCLHCIKEK
ncbi:MAG: 50S ribosomal protein L11 methyltransferase [Bacteroidales bacterium]|nr:50S ribosomal protein L11 methyltransferase [Bacteroidales bacterium]